MPNAQPPARRVRASRIIVPFLAASALAVPLGAQAATLLGDRPAGAAAPAAGAGAADATPQWSTLFRDDFNGAAGSQPSTASWAYDTGQSYPGGPANFGTGEVQSYTSSTANISEDGSGSLRITPLRDSSGAWTSARIETQRTDFAPPSGGLLRIESRISMPDVTGAAADGYWPAFWALGAPYRGNFWNWPGIGELDIMENVNGIDKVWGTLHCGTSPGGPCNETIGLANNVPCPGAACQGNFHTYAFEWDQSVSPNQFRWYVDGSLFNTVSQDQVPASTWTDITSHGYFVLLNLAMGGAFPDPVAGHQTPTAATEPGHPMLVDYVSVSSATGSGSTSTPPPTTSTTTSSTTPPPTTSTTTSSSSTSTTTPPTCGSSTTSGSSSSTSSSSPPPGSSAGSAYDRIEAESFSAMNGLGVEPTQDTGGGTDVTGAADGRWAKFSGVDFGTRAARGFTIRVASGAPGGVGGLVQIRLDSPTGAVLGDVAVASTGGWQAWRSVPGNLGATTGVHDVYVTFTSGQPAVYASLNWLTFTH